MQRERLERELRPSVLRAEIETEKQRQQALLDQISNVSHEIAMDLRFFGLLRASVPRTQENIARLERELSKG
jgi:hypothetical protein